MRGVEGRVVVVKAAQGAAQGDVVRGALAALGVPGLEAWIGVHPCCLAAAV